ncbi:MAG: DUF4358 domain-containing protein [Clostridia bacterium]|nr:DUF4358 domain-containing protein [Clostridia bacterium]MBQ2517336.1 DUF4358 domain-containing protein [Clostridia bacterium]
MKRFVTALLAALLIVGACFAACTPKSGSDDKNAAKLTDLDVNKLASDLASACKFDDQYLALVENREFSLQSFGIDPADVAEKDGVKESAIYVSSSTPEMIVVVKAANEEAFGRVESAVKARIDDYTNNYETYGPDQVAKLQSAVSRTVGQVLITVVSADNGAAQDVLAGLLK